MRHKGARTDSRPRGVEPDAALMRDRRAEHEQAVGASGIARIVSGSRAGQFRPGMGGAAGGACGASRRWKDGFARAMEPD